MSPMFKKENKDETISLGWPNRTPPHEYSAPDPGCESVAKTMQPGSLVLVIIRPMIPGIAHEQFTHLTE